MFRRLVLSARRPAALPVLCLLGLLGFWSGCPVRQQISDGVQLVLNPDTLEPTTTFELRFEQPVVPPDRVGQTPEVSPLVITPALRGQFVWLSQRSGVFTPTEPATLDTEYRFQLRAGLTQADGRPLAARLDRRWRTPPLRAELMRSTPFGTADTNLPAVPVLRLDFNANVRAAAAAGDIVFRSRNAGTMAARVAQANTRDWQAAGVWWANPAPAWRDLFAAPRFKDETSGQVFFAPVPPKDETFANALLVTPVKPLPVGEGWELVLARGLPAADGRLRLPAETRLPLGDVQPFIVTGVTPHNTLRAGRRIEVAFSKPLSPELNVTNLTSWVAVEPAPAAVVITPTWNSVIVAGRFELTNEYRVTIRRGLPAREPFALAADDTTAVQFEPMPPRLYFPEFSTEQLAAGRRVFPLLSVNAQRVTVRAKELSRDTLVHALRGYRSYYRDGNERDDPDEPFREIWFNLVPGRTLFERNYTLTNATDVAGQLSLSWDEVLAGRPHGAVFLEAVDETSRAGRTWRVGAEALVQLTDLGLVWKRSRDGLLAQVFSYTTGRPVAGAAVRLTTDENETLDRAVTDAAGLAPLRAATNAAFVLAETADDLRATALDAGGIPLYGFGLPIEWDGQPDTNTLRVMFFSDRPVYRPGDTVHLKAIARDGRDGAFTVPAGLPVTLRAVNAEGQTFLETNLVFGPLGSLDRAVALPSVGLGGYYAELRRGDAVLARHDFRVAEYKPDAFEVSLTTKPEFAAGETPAIGVGAAYLLGQPLTKANVAWSLRGQDEDFAPAGFDRFVFCGDIGMTELDRGPGSLTLEGQAAFATNLVLRPEVTITPRAPHPRRCELLAEVTDLNQQTVSQRTTFLQHSSAFYLGLGALPDLLRAGGKVPVNVVAVGADGQPWPTPVRARVTLQRVAWRTVRVEAAGGVVSYQNEPVLQDVAQAAVDTAAVVRDDGHWVTTGEPAARLPVAEAGLYLLDVTAKDAAGHDVVTATIFDVYGADQLAWNYRNEVRVELTPDRTNYAVGETATVLVKTPISGPALVTVERANVRRAFVTNLVGNAPAVAVPILAGDAPNVFVSVLVRRGAADSTREIKMPEYRLGYCQLNVTAPEARLQVAVKPDAGAHRPGELIRVVADITDVRGQPAADAEVTLFAVDEGVLSLTGFPTPDPYAFFFAPRPLAVTSGITLSQLMPEDPAQLGFQNKGFIIGGGGRARLRQNFAALAFWNASLRTDDAGRVTAEFPAPDNLTRYRIIAVAHDAHSRFGNSEASMEINKPLMIEPALPDFANVGDKLFARAVVLNRTVATGEVEVRLALDATATLDATSPTATLTNRVTVPARGSAKLDVPVEFVNAGAAKWTWRARFVGGAAAADAKTRGFADAVQSTLKVGYATPPRREVYLARVTGQTNLLAGADPQLLEGQGSVTVRVANTRLGDLGEVTHSLLTYPYGCVEQTASKLLPLLVLREYPAFLPGATNTAALERQTRDSVYELLAMQTPAGGLAYWPHGREPMLWGSAYGGIALALARRQGVPVGDASLDALAGYLRQQLEGTASLRENTALGDRCLALYALALLGKPEPASAETLFARRGELSGEAIAWLALAILEQHGTSDMVGPLLDPRAVVRAPGGWFGNAASELGARLLAWVRFRPQDPTVDVLVRELFAANRNGGWQTTQGNAWGLLALAEYAARVEAKRAAGNGAALWGGERFDFAFGNEPAAREHTFPVTTSLADVPLMLTNAAAQPVFTEVTLAVRPRLTQLPRQDRGYLIQRTYAKLDEQNRPQPATALRVGDRVLVTLTLEARQTAYFLAVDDALPAVFAAVNPEFKSREAAGAELAGDWVSDHRELRADRVLFFCNQLLPGRYTIRYLARVRAAGTVTAPPAKVEEMYHPERFGLTATETVTAAPLN
jgi:uncharacterized protein YfaS (alpha-2-macroglobulin family)